MQRKNLDKAKELLKANDITLALYNGEKEITSQKRGVSPLVDFLQSKQTLVGFSAADKVVGKGAAFLYVLLGVSEIYAAVISRPALDILLKYGIKTEYGTLVDNIINRKGDDICPIEASVLKTVNPNEAYAAIIKKLNELNGTKAF